MKTNENTDNTYLDSIDDLSIEHEALRNEIAHEALEEKHANEAVKGVAWLFGIVAVFALAILITWIIGSQSPFLDLSIERQAATLAHQQPLRGQVSKIPEKTTAQFMAILVPNNGTQTPNTKTAEATTETTANSSSTAMSQADLDRIEREAREVIHGDFGVNPGRKAKLGADYAAVQARVNEILH